MYLIHLHSIGEDVLTIDWSGINPDVVGCFDDLEDAVDAAARVVPDDTMCVWVVEVPTNQLMVEGLVNESIRAVVTANNTWRVQYEIGDEYNEKISENMIVITTTA